MEQSRLRFFLEYLREAGNTFIIEAKPLSFHSGRAEHELREPALYLGIRHEVGTSSLLSFLARDI
jgi:hypothetical protein